MSDYRKVLINRFVAQEKNARWAVDSFRVTTLDELLDQATANVTSQFKNAICVLLLVEEDYLVIKSTKGMDINKIEHKRIPIGKSLSGRLVKHGEARLFSNVSRIINTTDDNLEPYYCGPMASTPLVFNKEVIGLLNVYRPHISTPFSLDDFNIIITYGNQTAFAIKSQKLVDKRTEELKKAQEELVQLNEQLQKDIEARKKAEEQLRRAEEKYRTQFEGALDSIFVADAKTGILVDCNHAGTRLVGREKSELIGQHQRILHPPETNHGNFSEVFRKHLEEKQGQVLERQVITKDGKIKEVAITATLLEIGGKKVLQGIFRDITERKKAEQELTQLLSLYTAALEVTADGILVVDLEGRIVSSNKKFQQLWSIPKSISETKDDEKLLLFVLEQLEDPEGFLTEVQRLYSNPQEQSFDYLNFKDGRVFERFSHPQKIGDKIVGRVWSFRDITERVKAEKQQSVLLEQLEKVNQELQDFAYIVSHDLKAPLRGIKTLADWVLTDYADKMDEDGKEQLSLLSSRVDRMQNLIDGILQYSRVGQAEEEQIEVDLNELVPDIIDMLSPPENITITIENQLPVIECEQTRITQVFQNLLSNAIKYMDKSQGWVKIGCIEEDGFWKFSISDNGPGIEEKYFDKVFQIFQTLSSRDEYESTGIGLTVIKKIIELYSGRIWVESKVGEGSTFFFTLPVQEMGVKNEKYRSNIVS